MAGEQHRPASNRAAISSPARRCRRHRSAGAHHGLGWWRPCLLASDLACLLRALRDDTVLSAASWATTIAWSPGPERYYDDYGIGVARYRLGGLDAIGHHGVRGAFAFSLARWMPL
jgi:hypothetical protein